jgi:selT/selW/selH-like putative selenoprotein
VLQQRYPDLRFEGSLYPPAQWRSNGAQVLSYLKLAAIGCLLFGYNPFGLFGMQTPGFWLWAVENKWYACILAFFVGNMVENQLQSTGAFEVYLNDIEVWSKLKSGRVPSVQEIAQIIETQMRLTQPNQPGLRAPLEPQSRFSNAPPNQQQNQPPPVAPPAARAVDDDEF